MWKVGIYILCGMLICCTNAKNVRNESVDSIPLLDNVLDSVYFSKYKLNNKHVILCVFSYTIDSNKFLFIGPVPCIHKNSKSYLEYKGYLLDYIGIDDTVANIVLPLNKFKTDYPIVGYVNYYDHSDIHWDVKGKTYLIHGKDSLTLFHPDKEHERILLDILLKTGLFVPPPPPL